MKRRKSIEKIVFGNSSIEDIKRKLLRKRLFLKEYLYSNYLYVKCVNETGSHIYIRMDDKIDEENFNLQVSECNEHREQYFILLDKISDNNFTTFVDDSGGFLLFNIETREIFGDGENNYNYIPCIEFDTFTDVISVKLNRYYSNLFDILNDRFNDTINYSKTMKEEFDIRFNHTMKNAEQYMSSVRNITEKLDRFIADILGKPQILSLNAEKYTILKDSKTEKEKLLFSSVNKRRRIESIFYLLEGINEQLIEETSIIEEELENMDYV